LSLFIDAYRELFADIVAVVDTQDLDIMWKPAKEKEVENAGEVRSFSLTHQLEGWDSPAPFYLLAPTRTYLGKHQLKNLAALKDTDFLSKLLNAFIQGIDLTREDFIKQYNEDPTKYIPMYEVNAEKINRDLINILERAL